MSLRLAFAATTAAAALATLAGAALADPQPAADASAAASQQARATPAQGKAQAKGAPTKASAVERAAADRLEPLQRATFWMHETQVDPKDAEAGVRLSKALRTLNRNDEAMQAVERVLVFHPADLEALLELGRDDIQRNQPFYALEPLKKAAEAAPKDWRPLSLQGVAYDQLGRSDDARAAWQAALKVSPDNPAVLSNMAMSLAAAGEPGKAETLLRRAAQNPQATVTTRQDLALVLGMQGKTAEAEKLIRDDVPPDQASADLAWFNRTPPQALPPLAAPTPAAAPKGESRTWSSLETPGSK